MFNSAMPWIEAHQAPLSMGFSRQESWSGLPCPPPGDLPNPGIEPAFLPSPALGGGVFSTRITWEALISSQMDFIFKCHCSVNLSSISENQVKGSAYTMWHKDYFELKTYK